jgi:transcriptional regulator GlxA family with amidase domain
MPSGRKLMMDDARDNEGAEMSWPQNPFEETVEQIGVLLLPEYPIYALILAIEALRVANQNSGHRLFSWHLIGLEPGEVQAGNGMTLSPEMTIQTAPLLPTVLVCAGNQPTQFITPRLLNWLRRLDRHGARLGAIDTGAFALAAAGVLEGHRVTLHWEAMPMFRDRFPEIEVTEDLFVIDRGRLTCAGGIATLDMMLHLIALKHGQTLAQIVADGFVHQRLQPGSNPQRIPVTEPPVGRDTRLRRILAAMEGHLDPALTPREIAAEGGISVRQLERMLRARFGSSPMQVYLRIRLRAARNLLFYGDLPIKEVAGACGFADPATFSRAFRAEFAQTPREFRRWHRTDQLTRFRPVPRQVIGRADARGSSPGPVTAKTP